MENGSDTEYGESLIDVIDEEVSSSEDDDDDGDDEGAEGGKEVGEEKGKVGEVVNPQAEPLKRKKKKTRRKRKHKKGPFVLKSESSKINRFVMAACMRLKEKKTYKLFQAVAVLGRSAVEDLVKQVDAIQASGGQRTKAGDRLKTGGGILWSMIKGHNPAAYKTIMEKIRDFEGQLKTTSASTSQSTKLGSMTATLEDDVKDQKH